MRSDSASFLVVAGLVDPDPDPTFQAVPDPDPDLSLLNQGQLIIGKFLIGHNGTAARLLKHYKDFLRK
jgi:hypothetical protein